MPPRPASAPRATGRPLRPRPSRARPSRRGAALLAIAFAAAAAGAATGCGEPPAPHVLLVTLDTLRADHLGAYGYARDTSPALDAFAAGATRYANAWATAPWTVPTHASLFTGLHPFEHGARAIDLGADAPAEGDQNVPPLAQEHLTLAEVLQQEGYRTAGLVTNRIFLGPRYQLDQGFDEYRVERVPGDELTRRALAWVDTQRRVAPEQPFFLFLNFMDTHRPYHSRRPADARLPAPSEREPGALLSELVERVLGGEDPPPPELVREVIGHYDAAIANLDRAVGALLEGLARRGLRDRTLVVLTSDHGEYFGEHGLVEHSKDVYEPALRVPLLVREPGQTRGAVVETPVSSVDVPRLVLDALPPRVAERWAGHFPYRIGGHPLLAQEHYSRLKDLRAPWGARFRRVRTAWLRDGTKLIASSDGAHELYDLRRDPGESRDLAASEPERLAAERRALDAFLESRGAAPVGRADLGPALSDEERRELRALGYL